MKGRAGLICVMWLALPQKEDPWSVRVLPKVFFGAHPLGLDGVAPDDPGVFVLHHFLGSWKVWAVPQWK